MVMKARRLEFGLCRIGLNFAKQIFQMTLVGGAFKSTS